MALKHLITCVVAGIDYLVHPQILGSVEESVRADQIIPVVVLSESEVNAGPEELGRTLQYLVDHDDVCTDEFTGIIVVRPSAPGSASRKVVGDHASDPSLGRFSAIYHMADEHVSPQQEQQNQLPSGPYFLSGPNLHQAWRLYPDDLEAFTFGLIPDNLYDPQSFQPVTSQSSDGLSKTIPVPSRLYHRPQHQRPDPKRPLAGARISLKDTFDAEGVRTTLSSRAWARLYPAADASAPYVRSLLDQGAVVVGKTKVAGPAGWVDSRSPANPRGDGYQEPSGSSTGAAASIAGYGWLDYAVGAESAGGIGEPAASHGLHAIRSTFGSASLEGVRVDSPRYDTVGLLGRGLDDLVQVAKHSLDVKDGGGMTPSRRIIYPVDFFPLTDPNHQQLVEEFVHKLEGYMGVRRTEVGLAQLWQDKPPHGLFTGGESLQDYMKEAPFWSLCYDYYHASDQFRSDYREKFASEPFVEASFHFHWGIGANVTKDEYDVYLARLETFRTWFDKTIMSLSHEHADDAVMILPCGIDGPKYRDVPSGEPTTIVGVDPKLLSSMLGTPHVVVPFAQLPYKSRITKTVEYRPICISLMGGKGSDLALLRLAGDSLRSAGWRTDVDTGRFTFPVGDNSRHVKDDGQRGTGQGTAPSRPHVDDCMGIIDEL